MLQIFSLPLTGKNKFPQLVVWKLLNFFDNDVFLTIPIWCQCTNGISIVKLWCNLQILYLHKFYSLSWSQDQIMPQRGFDYNTWKWINLLWIWFGVLILLFRVQYGMLENMDWFYGCWPCWVLACFRSTIIRFIS